MSTSTNNGFALSSHGYGGPEMEITAFAEVTLQVADVRGVADFYRDAFGLDELADEGDRIWLAVGEKARLGIWSPGRKEFGDEGGVHVHFALTARRGSLDGLARRVLQAGGHAEGPVEHSGGDRSLYVRDPAGNVVEAWDLFDGSETVEELRDEPDASSSPRDT